MTAYLLKKLLNEVFPIRFFVVIVASAQFLITGCKSPGDITSADNQILTFALHSTQNFAGTIDHEQGTIKVIVPYETILNGLTSEMTLVQGATVIPAANIPQDFSKPIYYTVTTTSNSKKVYKVIVERLAQSLPEISFFSKDSVRAGEHLLIKGKNFGKRGSVLQVYLKASQRDSLLVKSLLIDSVSIDIEVPKELATGSYGVRVTSNQASAMAARQLFVKIPAPEITDIKSRHILQGDWLEIIGQFIDPVHYNYRLQISNENHTYRLDPGNGQAGKLVFSIDDHITPGYYALTLINSTENVTGSTSDKAVRIYDMQLPFVKKEIRDTAYRPGENVNYHTSNFEKLTTRFYQLELTSQGQQFNQTGIYTPGNQKLTFQLPGSLPSGDYKVRVLFLSTLGDLLYDLEFQDDLKITQ